MVSFGCGEYPEEPLGNTDIANLGFAKFHHVFHRVNSLWTLFKHAVCKQLSNTVYIIHVLVYSHTPQLNVSEETVRMSRISCEQQDIAFFRFSPLIGNDVGTMEKDNHKLCDIIIKLVN